MKLSASKGGKWLARLCLFGLLLTSSQPLQAQRRAGGGGPPTLGLANGYIELETPDFNLKLVKDSQTVAALEPKGVAGYDFTPRGRGRREPESTNVVHQAFDFTPAGTEQQQYRAEISLPSRSRSVS